MNQGIYSGLPFDEYVAAEGISRSRLSGPTPAHWNAPGKEETAAMLLGSVIHCAILEPEELEKRYQLAPECRRGTKAWKEAEENAEGRQLVPLSDWESALAIRDSVWTSETAEALLKADPSQIEQSVFWEDPDTGLRCKARPDVAHPGEGVLVDLKSTQDASPEGFARSAARYAYHCQAAWYKWGYGVASGESIDLFVFVAVEKSPPYAVGFYELPSEAIYAGWRIMRDRLFQFAECKQAGHWPSYSTLIQTLPWPKWGY